MAASVSFTIERGLMTVLRPGDPLSIAALPSLGLSIAHRDDSRGSRSLVEIDVAGESRILPWGRPTMGSFEFYIQDGVKPGVIQASIERLKICPARTEDHSVEGVIALPRQERSKCDATGGAERFAPAVGALRSPFNDLSLMASMVSLVKEEDTYEVGPGPGF